MLHEQQCLIETLHIECQSKSDKIISLTALMPDGCSQQQLQNCFDKNFQQGKKGQRVCTQLEIILHFTYVKQIHV